MKKILSVLLAVALLCGGVALGEGAERLSVITTIFPAYDFARQVLGDAADVTMLLPPGFESHTYEPSPQDIIRIQNADLFIYNGGESDHWVADVLDSMGEQAPQTLAMTDCVELVEEEISGSMEADASDDAETDEHVWTSPLNAIQIVDAITAKACELIPSQSDAINARAVAYTAQLQALDEAFHEVVANGQRTTVVFGDRFPFRYLADELGLTYDAAFPGCSEDSEPSAKTIVSLIAKVREENVPVVFYIEFSSQKTANVIAEETGAKTLLLHSCHNVSQDELDAGATYLSLMTNNVQALKEALS